MNNIISWNEINSNEQKQEKKQEKKQGKKHYGNSKFSKLQQKLEDIKINDKKRKFHNWLNKTNIDDIKYTVIISHLCNDLITLIKNNNNTISDEKQLRNEIATFIYSISK